jgi:tetratricopeptide (TPR) repeat protein
VRRGSPAVEPEASTQIDLGIRLQMQGKLTEAVACYERALEAHSGSAAALNNRGLALHALGRLNEAAASLAEAVARHPEQAEAHTGLGNVLHAQGCLTAAAACHERALGLRPEYAEAWTNLGVVRHLQGRLDEAAECCARAVLLKPEFAEGYNNLGDALQSAGRLEEAARCFVRAIELKPQYVQAHINLATNWLLQGNFAGGWLEYEWRLKLPPLRDFGRPRWNGEPLGGARILLYAEQGLGDTLQFLRYLPGVQAAGGTIVLEVQQQLRRLAEELPGIEVLAAGELLPDFDLYYPLMSLPSIFGTNLDRLPAPYLSVPREAVAKAAGFLWPADGLRVGLVWAGNPTHIRDRFRSIPPALLEPLLDLEGAQFFSLQIDSLQVAGPHPADERITDLAPEIEDMADTAALIAHLDLVIAADTSVAHLAGALGRPVWVMLPFAPDWRWLLGREDSPWYPAMRLFRQTKPGDWIEVMEAVRSALAEKIAGKKTNAAGTAAKAKEPVGVQAGESDVLACKICCGPSPLFGMVDFHKSCIEAQGKRLPLSGVAVHYRRCERCGFVFTDAFDGWAMEEFERRVYNKDYLVVDPDFVSVRPLANAGMVAETFQSSKQSIRILDYGGGSGLLAERLRATIHFRSSTRFRIWGSI